MEAPSPVWWKRYAQNRLLDVGLLTMALICVARIAALLPARAVDIDFSHYYISSRLVVGGQDPYRVPLGPLYGEYGFIFDKDLTTASNPPPLLWVLAPLALLPATVAFWCWVLIQVASLIVVLWLTWRLIGSRLSSRAWRFFMLVVLSSAPVYWHFFFSQVQLPVAALVLLAYANRQAGRHLLACLLIAFAGTLKLYPLVLLPWFVWRADGQRGRCVAGSVGALAALVALTGIPLWQSFLEKALPAVTLWSQDRATYTVPAFIVNLRFAAEGFDPVPVNLRFWWNVAGMVGMAIIVAAYGWCLWRGGDREAEFCLLTAVMVVSGVTAWIHYMVLLIFPLAVMTARLAKNVTGRRIVAFGGLLLLLNYFGKWAPALLWINRQPYAATLFHYGTLYGVLAVGGYYAAQLRRRA